MKLSFKVFLILLCAGIAGGGYAQNAITINRWDAGLSGGGAFYGDVAGVNGMLESRVYLLQAPYNLNAFTGAGSVFQYTANDEHSMTNVYGYALGGVDWFFLKDKLPDFDALSLRAQLAIGGGYTSDKNTDNTVAGAGGFILSPTIGADYGFGKIHASLMFGYQVIGSGGAVLTASTIAAGVSYSIFDRSVK